MYKINIGNFSVGEIVYENRCLSASIGGSGIDSDVIPWKNTEYNPWDYKYENEQFVLDAIVIPTPTPTPSDKEKLEAQVLYTAIMTDTVLEEE